MTREFENFLIHFTQEIENAQSAHKDADEVGSDEALDRAIVQMMELAESVYPQEVTALLNTCGVKEKIQDMKARIDLNMDQFQEFRLAADWKEFEISYYGEHYSRAVLHLEEAMQIYFRTAKDAPEFYFITAYLAKDDNFVIIQLYHFLQSIRH